MDGAQFEKILSIADYAIKAYLPDDSTQLSVLVSPEKENLWLTKAMDGLRHVHRFDKNAVGETISSPNFLALFYLNRLYKKELI